MRSDGGFDTGRVAQYGRTRSAVRYGTSWGLLLFRGFGWVALGAVVLLLGSSRAAGRFVAPGSHQAVAIRQCSDSQYPAKRDSANPLVLPSPPGSDPLSGAHLFIDGPRHGAAAGAIAQLLGVDPEAYADNYSWPQFEQLFSPGGQLYGRLADDPDLMHKVALLAQIASQEETQNISLYAQGGGPGAIFSQVQKILCHNLSADPTPHTVPVFSTFFIYPDGRFCPPLNAILSNWDTFKRQIGELAAATGRHPVIYLLEIDAIGTSRCLKGRARRAWEAFLRYEIETLTALPHTVVYVEGGAADENSPQYIAKMLGEICVTRRGGRLVNVCSRMRGFYVNGTRFDWSRSEIGFGDRIVILLRRRIHKATDTSYTAHFVVNTAQNGKGPQLNPHPVQQGSEALCNPPGRGLGRVPTAHTDPTFDGNRFPLMDAFLWTGVPGRSHNSHCPGGPWQPAGVFDSRFALELASNASNQLGPPQPAPPVLGKSFNASTVSGIVYVRLPHATSDANSAAVSKGLGFVPLTVPRSLPMGTQIDSRLGTVAVVTASPRPGKMQSGTFGGGLFSVAQDRRGPHKGLATLSLLKGTFAGAPSYGSCRAMTIDAVGPLAWTARLSGRVVQALRASAHGRFRTRGRYAAATVRGTAWTITDRCDGTLITVQRHTVAVTDFVRHITVLVHAGQSYLALSHPRLRRGKPHRQTPAPPTP